MKPRKADNGGEYDIGVVGSGYLQYRLTTRLHLGIGIAEGLLELLVQLLLPRHHDTRTEAECLLHSHPYVGPKYKSLHSKLIMVSVDHLECLCAD